MEATNKQTQQQQATTKDEVDFVCTARGGGGGVGNAGGVEAAAGLHDGALKYKYTNTNNNNNNNNHYNNNNNNNKSSKQQPPNFTTQNSNNNNEHVPKNVQMNGANGNGNCNNNNSNTNTNNTQKNEKRSSTKERLSLFSFGKKIVQKTTQPTTPPTPSPGKVPKEQGAVVEKKSPAQSPAQSAPSPRQHKFVKSSSLSRLLGNTYNAKKHERDEQKRLVAAAMNGGPGKFNTFGGRRRLSGPLAKPYAKEEGDVATKPTPNALNGSSDAAQQQLQEEQELGVEEGVGEDVHAADDDDLWLLHSAAAAAARHDDGEDGLEHFREYSSANVVGGSDDGIGDGAAMGGGDLGMKAMRTLSRGLGRLWWRRTNSVNISTPDPEFKVAYLGNVLTGWAKGEGSIEKQLNTLWRNYTQHSKPDVIMRMRVCASGLKATTRQHGLTEYWANRITHCCAPRHFPRIFCWIYRHEGRKLKHELRCHAVLCSKEKIAQDICATLKENLESALREFKREKILKQNARLSLANAVYDNPSMPRRKILLSVGANNYRPPLERSKSAPKLMAIEEAIGEEGEEEVEETNEPEMKPCCQKDSLYPAMTLGRRRCRRGHSIRRTGKARATFSASSSLSVCEHHHHKKMMPECVAAAAAPLRPVSGGDGSDDSDDFEKLLKHNDYDSTAPLANELLPYFDRQLHQHTSNSLGDLLAAAGEEEPLSLLAGTPTTINSDPSADPLAEYDPRSQHVAEEEDEVEHDVEPVSLRRQGVCSDGEEDYLDAEDMYFRQASILNMLHRHSMRKMANMSLSSDENSSIETNVFPHHHHHHHSHHQGQSSISSNASSVSTTNSVSTQASSATASETGSPHPLTKGKAQTLGADSDEGSISSGCETASTATTNQDDLSLQYQQKHQNKSLPPLSDLMVGGGIGDGEEAPITAEEIYQRLESRLQGRNNSDATTFSSSSSITLKLNSSPTASVIGLDGCGGGMGNGGTLTNGTGCGTGSTTAARNRRTRRTQREQRANNERNSDSECSDESGYVEFQEQEKSVAASVAVVSVHRPQVPPKPMPRKLTLPTVATNTNATNNNNTHNNNMLNINVGTSV